VDYAGTPDEYGDHTLAGGTIAVLQTEGSVNVKQYGATGDGVTDDTAAIQAALDSSRSVFLPTGNYKITSTLNQTLDSQLISGAFTSNSSTTIRIFLDASSIDDVLMNVRGPSSTLRSLIMEGKGRTAVGSYIIDADEEGFDGENNGDVDLALESVTLTSSETHIKIKGRGLTASSCNFVDFNNSIEIDWPSTFVAGPNPDQKLKTGMRVYVVQNCRFHAGSGNYIMKNTGTNAANLHGVQFSNNYIDTLTSIFNGELHDSLITNNVVIHSHSTVYPLFNITAGSNFVINNNVFYGMDDNGDGTELDLLSVMYLTSCVGCQINNNTINRVDRDVISIGAGCSNISICNNIMRNVCLSNDGGTSRSPVRLGANIDKLQVKDNIIDLTELSPASWVKSEIIKNTGGYTVSDHDLRGNIYDETYWNLHNFADTSTINIAETDRKVIRYTGDGTASQTFTCSFKPMAVMAFNTDLKEAIMVTCTSGSGASLVNIDGYDIIVGSTFNTNLQVYYLYPIQ